MHRLAVLQRIGLISVLLALWCVAAGAAPKGKKNEKDAWEPVFLFREGFRLELEAKVLDDFRSFSPALTDVDNNKLKMARFGVKGQVFQHFHYEIEREFRGDVGGSDSLFPWKDVYVEAVGLKPFDVKVGKYKLPFGMEENISDAKLDFVYRSQASNFLTPSRDTGIMASGRINKKWRVNYESGVFRNDGENTHEKRDDVKTGGRTFAAHITGQPLRSFRLPFRSLELGAAMTSSNVSGEDVKNSIRGETLSGETFFHRIYVQGQRLRLGTELNWTPGPFSLKGEYIHVSEERKRAGIRTQDLPDLIARGWYFAGTWILTGEKKSGGRITPHKDFITGHGMGAIELAARYDALLFGSASHEGVASRSPRAPNILTNSDRVLTIGVNWQLNRFARIQVNGIREVLEDPQNTPIPGRTRYWMSVVRLGFDL